VITAHRVKRDLHGSLLLLLRHHFTVLIKAAICTDPMRQHGFIAVIAVLDLHWFDVQMASPLTLSCVRSPSFWNCHA